MNDILVSKLIKQLDHSDSAVHEQAKSDLVELGSVVIEPLIKAMHMGSENMKWQAANVLLQFNDPRCIEPMLEALRSPSLMLEHIAIEVLQKFDFQMLVPALIKALPYCHCSAQARIVVMLEKAGDLRAVTPLLQLLATADSALLRLTIIQTLGTLGDPSAIEVIRVFQDDEDAHVKKRARRVIETLENKSQGHT